MVKHNMLKDENIVFREKLYIKDNIPGMVYRRYECVMLRTTWLRAKFLELNL